LQERSTQNTEDNLAKGEKKDSSTYLMRRTAPALTTWHWSNPVTVA